MVAAGALAAVVAAIAVPVFAPDQVMPTAAALVYRPVEGKATDLLTDLAAKAAAQPAPPGAGDYQYLHTRTWSLGLSGYSDTEIFDAKMSIFERELWLRPGGLGRLEMTEDGGPVRREELSGGPAFQTVDSLRAPQSANRNTAQWFQAVAEVWSSQVVTPEIQSALLSILATKPNITVEGETTDRVGRRGIAFSAAADGTRSTTPNERLVIVLDPVTGMLLDHEVVATESGDLPIKTPCTTAYMVWLASGFTPDTDSRP